MATKKKMEDALPVGGLRGQVTSPGDIQLLEPADVKQTLAHLQSRVNVVMLDPWYNRGGPGGIRDDYHEWLAEVIELATSKADHVFVWGFPEIIAHQVSRPQKNAVMARWLTWYYKNCPSVYKGWRSSQEACLHYMSPGAKVYPEHFLNDAQIALRKEGKLRYLPGPATVLESPMNIGVIGKAEQTAHPSQKPERVYERLLYMVTKPGDTVCDPMCGSGTTGAVAYRLGVNAILCDASAEYLSIAQSRISALVTNGLTPSTPIANDDSGSLFDGSS